MREPQEHERKIAYKSASFRDAFDVGKSKQFEEIAAGRLKARRLGKDLIISHADGVAWLNSLPEREPGKIKKSKKSIKAPAPHQVAA